MKGNFTEQERAALSICQGNLSFSATPYADIAEEAGLTEDEVLALLRRLRDSGAIRRFGASIRHQKAGWAYNAMVGWVASEEQANAAGPIAAAHARVSHAYYRPTAVPDWPYSFYTMVHGKTEADCKQAVDELARSIGLNEFIILPSIKELKKTSMIYFPREKDNE